MDRLKQLSIRHIVALEYYGYKFKDFLLVNEGAEGFKFYHIATGNVIDVRR